jgi:integrase
VPLRESSGKTPGTSYSEPGRAPPIRRDNLHDRRWKPLLRRAGLPDIRFHNLRHTCATLLLTKGVHLKIVSEMLGHSSIAITLDPYSHVIPGLEEVAASAMEDALGDEGPRRW